MNFKMRRLPPLVPRAYQLPYHQQPSRPLPRSLQMFIVGSVIWAIVTIIAIAYYTGPGEGAFIREGFKMKKDKEDYFTEDDYPALELSTVRGFFKQDEPETDPVAFDYVKENFGLMPFKGQRPSTPQWQHFHLEILKLNRHAPTNVVYKVFFLGRHGEGYHNVGEAFYGTKDWDCYWSMLNGNGSIVWEDAELTPRGVDQSLEANAAWKTQVLHGLEVPLSFYSSPLMRSATTLNHTFFDVYQKGTRPVVKELLRETIGIHTCDKRSPKCLIAERLPQFTFEGSFTSTDQLWNPMKRESKTQHRERIRKVLHDIVRNDKNVYISITSHSGTVNAMLEVLGHRPFKLPTGAMIPVVAKVEFLTTMVPSPSVEPSETPPRCTGNDRVPAPVETGTSATVTPTAIATPSPTPTAAVSSSAAAVTTSSTATTPSAPVVSTVTALPYDPSNASNVSLTTTEAAPVRPMLKTGEDTTTPAIVAKASPEVTSVATSNSISQ